VPRLLSRSGAHARGFTDDAIRHRLRTGRWSALHPGVYLTVGGRPSEADRLQAAVMSAGPGAALSAAGALTQWRLRAVVAPARPLVLVPSDSGARPTSGVRVRRCARGFDAHYRNGVRVAMLPRALADYCRESDYERATSALSEAVRRRLCTAGDVRVEYLAGPRRGSRALRLAIEDAATNAWSLPEGLIGRALRRAGSPTFEQNISIRSRTGALLGIVDVWWEGRAAAMQVHGAEHHASAAAWSETLDRVALLGRHGIAVHQVTAVSVLRDAASVAADALRWLGAQRPPLNGGSSAP
jgi:hypothetical protein